MRVSCTILESFRRYQAGLCWCKEDCTCLEELTASIRGEFVPTPRMEAGSLFHKAVETMDPGLAFYGADFVGALRDCDEGRAARAIVERRGIHEAKWTVRFGDVLVVGKADLIAPPVAYDWKATANYSGSDYTDSLQWRFTLAALPELSHFRYETFRVWRDGDGPYSVKYLSPGQEFARYPELMADCGAWVNQFEGFIALRGLSAYVEDRPSNEFPEATEAA